MHEWALAESILVTVLEESKKQKLKIIKEIKVAIGELQQIENDIFVFALNEIKKQEEKLKNVEILIETEKSVLKCKNCNNVWDFTNLKENLNKDESEAIHFIPEITFVHTRCPKCGSPDFEIKTGRGVSITSIKGEK
jgi:hydrogenase nickel incorporation protein HypA/HybF